MSGSKAVSGPQADIGVILLQSLRDLQTVRSQIDELPAQTGQQAAIYNSLRSVLERTETNLQERATTILRSPTATGGAPDTLPQIRRAQAPRRLRLGASSPAGRRGVVKKRSNPRMTRKRNDANRLASQYGMRRSQRPSAGRAAGRAPVSRNIKRGHAAASPKVLPRIYRRDPTAPRPDLGRAEVNEQGLYNLVSRGFIARETEISSLAQDGTLRSRSAIISAHHQQFQRPAIRTNDAALANIRFDQTEELKAAEAKEREERKRLRRRAAQGPTPRREAKGPVIITPTVVVPDSSSSSQEQEQAAKEESAKVEETREDPPGARGYNELLDRYSLHQFIIRKGKVLDTPEFVSFKRTYAHIWGPISAVLKLLEQLVSELGYDMVLANGQRLVALAEEEAEAPPSRRDLLDCLGDMDSKPLRVSKTQMGGVSKRDVAARVIQSLIRMIGPRKRYLRHKRDSEMAKRIQRQWRAFLRLRATRKRMAAAWADKLQRWRAEAKRFKKNWPATCRKRRVAIHIPSISASAAHAKSMRNYTILQNTQFARVCAIKDPLIEVVYVAPYSVPKDILDYYFTLLEISGVKNARKRVRVVVPENANKFPEHFSLAKLTYYSDKVMRQIKQLAGGRPAYIVPGSLGPEDLQLAVHMGLPLMAPEPSVASLLGSQSGSKQLFLNANVPSAPGAYGIYDEKDFYRYFSKLIVENLDVQRWILKIDDERSGRGIAYLDPRDIQVYRNTVRQRDEDPKRWDQTETRTAAEIRMVLALQGELKLKIKLARKDLHPHWKSYSEAFFKAGGVIEACPEIVLSSPSTNLYIEPDGTVNMTSSHDQVFSSPYVYAGATFPSAGPHNSLYEASLAIGKAAYREGVIGYLGIDFVIGYDTKTRIQQLMAVDLNIRMTETCGSFMLFDLLVDGSWNPLLGEYRVRAPREGVPAAGGPGGPPPGAKRYYSTVNHFYQPILATMQFKSFFDFCRMHNVSYEVAAKQGTVFILMDSLACGMLGVLTIGRDLLSEVAAKSGHGPKAADGVSRVSTAAGLRASDVPVTEVGAVDAVKQLVTTLVVIDDKLGASARKASVFAGEANFDAVLKACKGLLRQKMVELKEQEADAAEQT